MSKHGESAVPAPMTVAEAVAYYDREYAEDRLSDELLALLAHARASLAGQGELADMEARKDAAYEERNRCVAWAARMALALGLQVAVTRTAIEGWSEDWHGCVYVETPEGQASWHFHDAHAHLFADLPRGDATWDGHTTPEKYERLHRARFSPALPLAGPQGGGGVSSIDEGKLWSVLRDAVRDGRDLGEQAVRSGTSRELLSAHMDVAAHEAVPKVLAALRARPAVPDDARITGLALSDAQCDELRRRIGFLTNECVAGRITIAQHTEYCRTAIRAALAAASPCRTAGGDKESSIDYRTDCACGDPSPHSHEKVACRRCGSLKWGMRGPVGCTECVPFDVMAGRAEDTAGGGAG